MCDTMVVLAGASASGRTMLAKNSDREPNEAQYLTSAPAADHSNDDRARCTYIDIDQAPRTHAVVGSRPGWMWGFEHGINEHGLAIGNEALWSRLPASREPGLLGMDLLRLALERATTADEALDVITNLLARHGQSGRASAARDTYYQNAFLLADPNSAWVLETAGRHWAAKRVVTTATISNVYSIGADYDRISDEAADFAAEQGWYDASTAAQFDFAAAYEDPARDGHGDCVARFRTSQIGMADASGAGLVTLEHLFALLRSHGGADEDPSWRPSGDGESMLCMHARSAEGFETAASMVAELSRPERRDEPFVYWASLCSPCLSSFVPVWLDGTLPAGWSQPSTGDADQWWRQERVQRIIELDYAALARAPRAILAEIEDRIIAEVRSLGDVADREARMQLSARAGRRQTAVWSVIEDMVERLVDGPLPPRDDDPRGDYLFEVTRSASETTACSAYQSSSG